MHLIMGGHIGPAGIHHVRLSGLPAEIENEIGAAYQWTWEIVNGPFKGQIFTRVTGRTLMGGTSLGDLLDMLYGRKLQEGDAIDIVFIARKP